MADVALQCTRRDMSDKLTAGDLSIVTRATGPYHQVVVYHGHLRPDLRADMTGVTGCIGQDIDVRHRLIIGVTTAARAHDKLMVDPVDLCKRSRVVAFLADRRDGHVGRREGLIGELPQMARGTSGADQTMVNFSHRREETGEVTAATILTRNRHVIVRLTRRDVFIMATDAGATHRLVVYPQYRHKLGGVMTGIALPTGGYMVCGLAQRVEVVMAGGTVASHPVVVIEPHRLPAEIRMTVGTLVVYRNVIGRLAGHNDVVVAVLTATEDFVVIDNGNWLPGDRAVA